MTAELKRIMLVEDDADIAILATMALADIGGFEVVHVSSGAEALDRVAEVRPDMLVLDYSMPGMNGGETLTAFRNRDDTSDIPAVFMTASVMPAHVASLKALGAIDVFAKPFDPLALPGMVESAWETHHRLLGAAKSASS
jgi:CheY-like chemotaxis protein